jgi:signal transduction histidine kinase
MSARGGLGIGPAAISRLLLRLYAKPHGGGVITLEMYALYRSLGRCGPGRKDLSSEVMDDAPLPLAERLSARQWALIDMVLVALLAAASLFSIALGGQTTPAGLAWTVVRYLAVAAACGSLLFRRRLPFVVLGVVAVSVAFLNALGGQRNIDAGGGGLAVLALTFAVYSVAVTSTRRTSLATIGVAVGAIEVAALVAAGGPDWGATLLGLALAAFGWLAAENTRARRRYIAALVEQEAERERHREQQVRRASTDERLRIARELHDVVAHAMSIIAVRSGVARIALDARPQEAREALGIIEDTSRQALQELRTLVGVLRGTETDTTPAQREPAPGLADLEQLVTHIGDGGVSVDVHVDGEPRRLSPGVDLSAYRIVQEALTNVVRHAAPATAQLTLRYLPAELMIEVTDDGQARQQTSKDGQSTDSTGHGLIGMRERVALYGGNLQAERTPTGFRVLARIPSGEAAT